MKIVLLAKVISLIIFSASAAGQYDNWRGPDRSGIYPGTGLLQEWPADGPEMIWAFENLGRGYSSPLIAGEKIYVTGMEGETGYLYVLSLNGSLVNKFPYGTEFPGEGYPGSRNTPAAADDLVYIISSLGVLLCMNPENGNIVWQIDLFNDLGGRNIRWGLTENLLVDGDRIYCAPGGREHNIVALNRHNGEIIWSSEGTGEVSAYCSPLLIDHYGRKLLVTHMKDNLVALDAGTGRLMWSHPHANRWDVHPNTPLYYRGSIYAFSGYGKGGVKLKLNSVGDAVSVEWTNDLDNQMGGVILKNGHIYGSGQNNRFWLAVNWETGETVYSSRDIAKGTVIWADGRLYCYSERGELALVEPTSDGFVIRGQTDVTLGSDQHWAHPVISNGILYIRRGNALMAYRIT